MTADSLLETIQLNKLLKQHIQNTKEKKQLKWQKSSYCYMLMKAIQCFLKIQRKAGKGGEVKKQMPG